MDINIQEKEVKWYKKHGKYPDRISLTASGERYVIGDWSWNRKHPRRRERIEFIMDNDIKREHH